MSFLKQGLYSLDWKKDSQNPIIKSYLRVLFEAVIGE